MKFRRMFTIYFLIKLDLVFLFSKIIYFYLILFFFVFIYDIFRIVKCRLFCEWNLAYSQNKIYTYTDFIKKDLKKITAASALKFFIISWALRAVVIFQFLHSLDFLPYYFLCVKQKKKINKIKTDTSFLLFIFNSVPRIMAVNTAFAFAKKLLFTKNQFNLFLLNLFFIIIWGKNRWIIRMSVKLVLLYDNLKLNPLLSFYSFSTDFVFYAKEVLYDDTIKNYTKIENLWDCK
jgi:hypothetical protein